MFERGRLLRKARELAAAKTPEVSALLTEALVEADLFPDEFANVELYKALKSVLLAEPLYEEVPDFENLSTDALYPAVNRLEHRARAASEIQKYRTTLTTFAYHLSVHEGTSAFVTDIAGLHGDLDEAVEFIRVMASAHRKLYPTLYKSTAHIEDDRKATKDPLDLIRRTPFSAYFAAPAQLPLGDRMNHMHIVGGSGSGKTTLIENLLLQDLESDASIIVIDSQRDLIRKLSHLDLGKEVILVSPDRNPPALNVFDLSRLHQYSSVEREQVIAGAIQTFDYLFGSLLGADLTAKQSVFFRYVARLLLTLPETMGRNATILDMLRLMQDVAPYRAAIAALPDLQREFFERDFSSKTFAQTKEQIRYRLHAIIENPTLARLFTSEKTDIDIFGAMNRGAVILVDTAKDFLKGSSAHFGQIFISLVLQATLERAAIPASERRDAYLYVDEAADYFDQNIDDLLTEARKYRLGCVFAHQYLDQCTSGLRASFAANTGIKFASGLSHADARYLAPEMRTSPEFLMNLPKLRFAAFVRNHTKQAVSVPVRLGVFDGLPTRDLPPPSVPEAPLPASTSIDPDVTDDW